jgi:hypothetical protein
LLRERLGSLDSAIDDIDVIFAGEPGLKELELEGYERDLLFSENSQSGEVLDRYFSWP